MRKTAVFLLIGLGVLVVSFAGWKIFSSTSNRPKITSPEEVFILPEKINILEKDSFSFNSENEEEKINSLREKVAEIRIAGPFGENDNYFLGGFVAKIEGEKFLLLTPAGDFLVKFNEQTVFEKQETDKNCNVQKDNECFKVSLPATSQEVIQFGNLISVFAIKPGNYFLATKVNLK